VIAFQRVLYLRSEMTEALTQHWPDF
jgi:hypothetical protein